MSRAFGVVRQPLLLLIVLLSTAAAQSLYELERVVPRPDYQNGVVYLERWRGERYLGLEQVLPLTEYLSWEVGSTLRSGWQERVRREGDKRRLMTDVSGLIPDIELPRLPIFGEGSRIDISGRDRITVGGRQTFQRGTFGGASRGLLPELKLEQQLAVTLNGTIGDRTKVNIDHDSERDQAKNKVKLTYTGTEDEIVQSIELGDTRLSIPGTGYTGDLPALQGLFGATAKGRLAGVDVYAVASREESQGQSQSFSGRRRVFVDTIRCDRYLVRRFYRLPVEGTIRTLRVYVDDKNPLNNQAAQPAIATTLLSHPESVPANWNYDRAAGDFDLKTLGRDYFVHPNNVIEFASALGSNHVAGFVAYTATESLGGRYRGDTLILAMLKPELMDSLSGVWDCEMRNVYGLSQTGVTLKSLRIYLDLPSGQDPETDTAGLNAGRRFTQILGLDPDGDGRIQYPEFEASTGLIRFPGRRPFDTSALSVRDRVIYRKDPQTLLPGEGRFYYMVAEYSSSVSSYYLGQPDITEGSEKVFVDGRQLTRGSDYTIDYKSGVVTFVGDLPADADIRVTYEYRPLFSIAQKAVMGTRAETKLGERGKAGASLFYRSEGTGEEKPSLGSEPFTRTIAEADASWSLVSEQAAAFLDGLPLLRAQTPVSVSASTEAAVSLPNPNTRGSAWLDDFQGTNVRRSVVLSSILWSFASVPAGRDTARFASVPLRWYNPPFRADTFAGPYSGGGRELEDEVPSLMRVVFDPTARPDVWAGIMTNVSQIGMNLRDVENLQLVLRSRRGRGRIHVSIGMSIDEDAPRRSRRGRIVGYNGVLDSEDRDGNGQIDISEDTGLDGVPGLDSLYEQNPDDDGNDDYSITGNPNGTEGNNRLDSEDLDRNGFSRYNHYFEFTVELGDERYFSSLRNGWQLCRISLRDSLLFNVVGQPKWEDIRTVRFWLDGFDGPDTIDLYSMEFTGTSWLSPTVRPLRPTNLIPVDTSEKVWVAEISRKTDTSYVPPVEPRRDLQGQYQIDPGLLFGYRNLYGNRRALVSKATTEREDYRDYTDLRVYVHDDGNNLGWVLRLGSDTANFYEFTAPITSGMPVPGRDGRWYEFVVRLDSFPLLKPRRDSAQAIGIWGDGHYRVLGFPSLSDIRYTAIGIDNPGERKLSGGVWFDELRLTGARREPGYGFQARTALTLSDFGSAAVSYSYSDPNFRRFSEGRGVRAGGFGNNLAFNAQANIDRFLPQDWGLSLPFSYTMARLGSEPKYSPVYPDLRLAEIGAAADTLRSVGWSEELALSNVRKSRSKSKVLNYTLEAMGLSWRRRRAASQSPLARDSTFSRSLQWSWAVNPDWKVELGETELALFPQSVQLGLANGYQLGVRGTRLRADSLFRFDTLLGNVVTANFSTEYSPLEDLTFEYSDEAERDLIVPNPDSLLFVKLGSEAGREQNFGASWNVEIADWLNPSFDYNAEYDDERPKTGQRYADYRNIGNSGDLDVSLGLDLPELLGRVKPPSPKPKAAPSPEGDSAAGGDKTVKVSATPLDGLRRAANFLSRSLETVDASWSLSRNSDILGIATSAPWHYRLGFSDRFDYDSLRPPTAATRELRQTARVSSGARLGDFSARLGWDWSVGRNSNAMLNQTIIDRSATFPDAQLTLGRLQRLFARHASDSKLTTSWRRRQDLGGTAISSEGGESLAMVGRTDRSSDDFNPLLSWQTTWKKRVGTTVALNYSHTSATNYLAENGLRRNVTDTRTRGGNLSLSYSFSAPQGIKLPLLSRVKFTSDLSLSATMRYSNSTGRLYQYNELGALADTTALSNDNSFGTTLAASYRFSRSIEAGLNSGYSYSKGLTPIVTETFDLNLWVLFRF